MPTHSHSPAGSPGKVSKIKTIIKNAGLPETISKNKSVKTLADRPKTKQVNSHVDLPDADTVVTTGIHKFKKMNSIEPIPPQCNKVQNPPISTKTPVKRNTPTKPWYKEDRTKQITNSAKGQSDKKTYRTVTSNKTAVPLKKINADQIRTPKGQNTPRKKINIFPCTLRLSEFKTGNTSINPTDKTTLKESPIKHSIKITNTYRRPDSSKGKKRTPYIVKQKPKTRTTNKYNITVSNSSTKIHDINKEGSNNMEITHPIRQNQSTPKTTTPHIINKTMSSLTQIPSPNYSQLQKPPKNKQRLYKTTTNPNNLSKSTTANNSTPQVENNNKTTKQRAYKTEPI